MASALYRRVRHPLAEDCGGKYRDSPVMFLDGQSSFGSSLKDFYFYVVELTYGARLSRRTAALATPELLDWLLIAPRGRSSSPNANQKQIA
jgi:hypothetical protein